MSRMRFLRLPPALFALGMWVLFGTVVRAEPPERITLQLKWHHQFQFAGYYAAIRQGYYREAGLDVTLRQAASDKDPIDDVLEGKAQYGIGNSELLLRRAQGAPLVMLAVIFQHSPLVLLARGDRGITSLASLHDKPIMISPLSAEIFAYFRDEGINPATLHVVPSVFGIGDLLSGKVAAMAAYLTHEPYFMRQAGVPAIFFAPRAGGIDFYGDNLFTTEDEVRRHPARVRAFRKASLRGWEYAMAHPNEVIDDLITNWKSPDSREKLQFEAEKTAEVVDGDVVEIGHLNPGRWRRIADTYAEFGMMPPRFSLRGFLYDPDPKLDRRWIYGLVGLLGLVSLALGAWLLPLLRLNRRLRHEIGERRRIEAEAAASDASKRRYVAVMSHEIRSSLGGIQGLAQITEQGGALAPEQRENIRLIDTTAGRLLHLVDNALDYSKVGPGGPRTEQASVVLDLFLGDLCRLYQVSATGQQVALSWSLDPGVPPAILTDPMRLRQVVGNLVSNAIKFTRNGAVAIAVHADPLPWKDNGPRSWRLRIAVRDTGIGIAEAELPRLFQPYAQANPGISRDYGGTGLGLAISQNLAGLLGGRITVESALGRGSTFTLEFPAEEPGGTTS